MIRGGTEGLALLHGNILGKDLGEGRDETSSGFLKDAHWDSLDINANERVRAVIGRFPALFVTLAEARRVTHGGAADGENHCGTSDGPKTRRAEPSGKVRRVPLVGGGRSMIIKGVVPPR